MARKSAFLLLSVLAIGGCAVQTVTTAVPATGTTVPATGTAVPGTATATTGEFGVTPEPVVTPEPTPTGPATYQVGDAVTVTESGADWATITISAVKVVASYKSPYGAALNDKPKTAGDVFIQAKVTYKALTDGVDYNPFDWQVFCGGEAVSGYTFVMYGPTPALNSGTLPNGRSASGYVVYEVPAKGEVRMSYGGRLGGAPVFEVVIRAA